MKTLELFRRIAVLLALAVIVFVATGCGSSSDGSASDGNSTDAAFAAGMIPHHESAIAMAKIGQTKSDRPEVKALARSINSSQSAEITTMRRIQLELKAHGVKNGSMGMSERTMGMDMAPGDLNTAKPFDRGFIDMMIPHHAGAIAMANVELAKGTHPQLKKIAAAIVVAQKQEIRQMQNWRKRWYGAELVVTGSTGSTQMTHGSSMSGH
jgi:uncharacterized protein (DUF305 family)